MKQVKSPKVYPRINVVCSSPEERRRFLKKVRKLGLTASGVLRKLADLWVKDQIKLSA
jgi:RNase P/RNase MRP subunit p30